MNKWFDKEIGKPSPLHPRLGGVGNLYVLIKLQYEMISLLFFGLQLDKDRDQCGKFVSRGGDIGRAILMLSIKFSKLLVHNFQTFQAGTVKALIKRG